VPGWCTHPKLLVNGQPAGDAKAGSYCRVQRAWQPGDTVTLELPMPIVARTSDPRVYDNRGRLALMRGPLVYCMESVDNKDVDVINARLSIDPKTVDDQVTKAHKADLLAA